MPQGKIPVAIKFADLLTPDPPKPPRQYQPGMRVPQPNDDIEQVKRDVEGATSKSSATALSPTP